MALRHALRMVGVITTDRHALSFALDLPAQDQHRDAKTVLREDRCKLLNAIVKIKIFREPLCASQGDYFDHPILSHQPNPNRAAWRHGVALTKTIETTASCHLQDQTLCNVSASLQAC